MSDNTTLRVKKISPFLKSNGVILKSNLFIFLLVVFESFMTIILFIDYKFFTYTNLDSFEILNKVGGDIFIINRYFILHYIDNLFISTFNSWFSDIKSISIQIPYFNDYIEYGNFQINLIGYIEIFLSIILTLIFFSLVLLQIREQQKFSSIGLHSIYSPLMLIIFSIYYKDYYFYKRVIGIKSDFLNNDKKKELIELFFYKSIIYKSNDIKKIELKTETLSMFFGYYNFYRLSLELKEPKKR